MKKILFLPFLQIPSGHHQAADALMAGIQTTDPTIRCKKVDILQYSLGNMEAAISKTYLKWIHVAPQIYSWTYQKAVFNKKKKEKRYIFYDWIFLQAMKKLLEEERPDLIVCTHGLPSYIVSRYKKLTNMRIPVINVYTDYFVHNVWGTTDIDYHFAASPLMKEQLKENGIDEKNIYMTGIPIHPHLQHTTKKKNKGTPLFSVLITGGSLGAGIIDELIHTLGRYQHIHYYVLCGHNEKLFQKLRNISGITPLPYIHSRKKMNELYNRADAIITKPGGVTISECIHKKLPIFVYHSLPGQEEINLHELKQMGLVIDAHNWQNGQNLEEQLMDFIQNKQKKQQLYSKINDYHQNIEYKDSSYLLYKLLEKQALQPM